MGRAIWVAALSGPPRYMARSAIQASHPSQAVQPVVNPASRLCHDSQPSPAS